MNFRCIVMGAAGRDFHDVQTFFRTHPEFRVCAITAAQIPFIASRSFPRELAGPTYAEDIPIVDESELPALIDRHEADFVFLAYSDLSHDEVMHRASISQAHGASFVLLGPRHTQLKTTRTVVSVTASRTGAGKSPLTQALAAHLRAREMRVAVLRHPMPYGDLRRQVVERLATFEDLDRFDCTLEEREEYVPYIERGIPVFAGVDYAKILVRAEGECDVILWDGGNNDFPFVMPHVSLVVLDAMRPGHELRYYPGETNLRAADIAVISKVSSARSEDVAIVRANVAAVNPRAVCVEADLEVRVESAVPLEGKRVLVVEDAPTVTHGGMAFGAGMLAAKKERAVPVDPRPFAIGTIADAFAAWPHLDAVLPALGYSAAQRRELTATIEAARPDAVLDASPSRIARALQLSVPVIPVRYTFAQRSGPDLLALVEGRVRARLAER